MSRKEKSRTVLISQGGLLCGGRKGEVMGRKWMSGILFVLGFFVLAGIAGRILSPKTNENLGAYNAGGFYGLPEDTLDIAVIGDSNAAEGIAVPLLWGENGYTAYVSAAPWSSVSQAYNTLTKMTENQDIKLLILEMGICFQKSELEEAGRALDVELKSLFPAYEYHNRFKELTLKDFVSSPSYDFLPPLHGYHFSAEVIGGTKDEGKWTQEKGEAIGITQRLYLNRILSFCRKRGISVLFVSVPSLEGWSLEKHDLIEELAQKEGIPYIDFNMEENDPGMDWARDSRDGGTHLNIWGAEKVTKALGTYLEENWNLTDHRGDEAYRQWETDYQEFERLSKQAMQQETGN